MDAITLHSAFEPSSVKFAPMSKTSKGGKIVYLNFPNNQKIVLQTPVMSSPFGISTYDDASDGKRSYSLDASFKGYDTNPKLGSFLTKCRGFDELLIDTATENSKLWFGGKEMSRDMVSVLFRKSIRDANDARYAPTLRLKISPSSEYYDEHQNKVDMDYIVKGTSFRAIVELSSVFFVNKQFGVTWRIVQLAVTSRPDRLSGFAFQGEDDDDGAEGM
jgi:hypothetical protein